MSQTGPPADAKQAQAAALQELEAAQKRKRAIDTSLATLESSIYAFENSYLEESAASGGNIIKGFDNYLKPPAAINKKKLEVTNEDRLFSTSSGSFAQSMHLRAQLDHELAALARRGAAARYAQSQSTTTTTTLYSLDPATLTNPTAGGIIDPTLLRGGRPVLVIPPTPLPSLRKTTTSRIGSASTAYAPERTPTLAALETSVHDAPRLTYKAARFSSVPAGLRPTHNQVSPFATEALSDPGAISSAPAAHENMPGLADEVDIQIQAMLDESQPEPDFDQASAEDDQRPARSRSRAKRNQATRAMDGDRGTRGPAGKEGANGRSRKIKRSRSYTSSASARE